MCLFFGADDVDVVGDEEFPDTRCRCAPTRYQLVRTEIGFPLFLAQLFIVMVVIIDTGLNETIIRTMGYFMAERFVFTGPNLRESDPMRPFLSGQSVKVDGDAEHLGQHPAEILGALDALLHRNAIYRDERADVQRPHPRVFTYPLIDSLRPPNDVPLAPNPLCGLHFTGNNSIIIKLVLI